MFKKKDVLFTNVLHNRLLMYSIDQSLNLVFFYPSDRNLKIFFIYANVLYYYYY